MEIVLGYGFDGGAYPDALGNNDAAAGKVVLGPSGLLSVLETRLGLKGPMAHPAVRVGQYHAKLKAVDNGERFFSRSFEADGWATANELLEWRDQLVFGGWDGRLPKGASSRLKDIAAVEALPVPILAPGFGERMRATSQALKGVSNVGIEIISLTESEDFWPISYQKLFGHMKSAGINFKEMGLPDEVGDGDLALLQQSMEGRNNSGGILSGDDRVILLVGQTEADAAEALAEWLAADKDSNGEVLIVKDVGSRLLDEALHSKGLPRLGADSSSQWRAALQVLLLALKNAWKPVDPHLLLEILTLPNSPIPRWAGYHFEKALRNHPGTGGPAWNEAWDNVLTEKRTQLEKKALSVTKVTKALSAFESTLRFWLTGERFDSEVGMPVEAVQHICSEVAQWAASRGGHDGDPLLIAAMSQSTELAKVLEASSLEYVTRPQLNRMVGEVLRFGESIPGITPEAAQWSTVKEPGQVWGKADTVVWWSFLKSTTAHSSHNWTKSELKALADVDVFVEEPQKERLREVLLWRRPVMMAQQRLLLVMHMSEAAGTTTPHPLFDEIRQSVAPSEEDVQRITVDASDLRKKPKDSFGSRSLERVRVEMREIPRAKPIWEIPPKLINFCEVESATSLEKLLSCPFAWVLNYHARVRMGSLLSLPQDIRLAGIVGHAVIERLFDESKHWDPVKARVRAMEIYDGILPMMAAGLIQPGRTLERQRNRETIGDAAAALVKLLNDCVLTVEDSEQEHVKQNNKLGVSIRGFLDIVLRDNTDGKVILDLKWTRSSKYRREEVKQGSALQLATYAWLLAEESEVFPPAGYYMLAQRELFASDVSKFPGQAVVDGPPLSDVWSSMLTSCLESMTSLRRGTVEAPGVGSETKEKTKACKFCNYGSLCGMVQEGGV